MTMQQYCLRWNNHQPNFISVFSSLLNNESLVDVTLAAEGKHLQAHKVVLAACSSYFQSVFTVNPCQHPIVILKDVKFLDLKVMVDFMYYGEVNVSQEQLPHILKTAEMLKIKGLAEIPVDQSTLAKSHNNVNDRAEVITGDTHWNTEDIHGHTLSPSPSPLSPASRRKRFRKASTGSGSGSTERILEEQPLSEVTVTSPGGSVIGTVIKPDPGGFSSDSSPPLHNKHFSSDTELHRSSSHESNGDCPQQITLQVPQQQESLPGVDPIPSSLDVGSSINQQTTADQKPFQTVPSQSNPLVMGTKRGRFLMRQPRIKRESDSSQNIDGDNFSHYLSVPPFRMERQCSDPLPTISPSPPPSNLLTVPGGSTLVKQHSHPLLPNEIQQVLHASPLQIQILSNTSTSSPSHSESERAVSPVVVVAVDPLGDVPSTPPTTTPLIRIRTDELKRSASSPQSGTRLSHCPVVRPGPALGCNYCWNTVDNHGRILRRKTKYHCPECQTNLCIVPCFQEYHERHGNTGQTDPLALTTTVMKSIFPKTSSM